MRSSARVVAAAALGVLVAGGSVLGLAAPAQAHNYLVTSSPLADSTLTTLPEEFSVTTNERLLDLAGNGSGFALQVVDEGGLYYGDGCVTVEGASIYTTPSIGAAGVYTVLWQIVSADGHTVSDSFTFEWAPDGSTPSAGTAEGSATAPVCGATAGEGSAGEGSAAADEADGAAPAAASDDPYSATDVTDLLWIGGALISVAAAVGIALFAARRPTRR